jgi:hypothetical protein
MFLSYNKILILILFILPSSQVAFCNDLFEQFIKDFPDFQKSQIDLVKVEEMLKWRSQKKEMILSSNYEGLDFFADLGGALERKLWINYMNNTSKHDKEIVLKLSELNQSISRDVLLKVNIEGFQIDDLIRKGIIDDVKESDFMEKRSLFPKIKNNEFEKLIVSLDNYSYFNNTKASYIRLLQKYSDSRVMRYSCLKGLQKEDSILVIREKYLGLYKNYPEPNLYKFNKGWSRNDFFPVLYDICLQDRQTPLSNVHDIYQMKKKLLNKHSHQPIQK